MRLSLNGTDCEKLELELGTTSDGPITFILQALRSVAGVVETNVGNGTRLRNFRATSAELQSGSWDLPALAIALGRQALLDRLNLQLDVAAVKEGGGVSGRASLGRAELGAATLHLASGPRIGFDLVGDGLLFERSPEGAGHVSADVVSLSDAQFGAGQLLARLGALSLDDARLDFDGQGLMFGSGAGQLERLSIESGRITIDVQQLRIPQGARTSGGTVVIPEITIPDARLAIDDLTELIRERLAERNAPVRPAEAAAGEQPERPVRPPPTVKLDISEFEGLDEPEYAFLDRVSGRLDVDLTMALTIPVIGRRQATHHFRIPIVNGVINYRDLERDLADLEDAFIDVEVRGKALVIERKIPIIGLERPLVIWDLDDEELELAKKRLVRLRTVPKLRMAARDSKAVVKVRQLDFEHIELTLEMAPPASDSNNGNGNDPTGQASIGQVRIAGSVSHHTSRPQTEPLPATEVSLNADAIVLGPFKIPLGDRRLDIDRIEIAEISPGKVVFDGVYPRTSSIAVRGIKLTGVRIRDPRK